ncbi:MAG TPA: response regulator transcription factor [bacterium]|nr:response regulator transcription factor [bacterium]
MPTRSASSTSRARKPNRQPRRAGRVLLIDDDAVLRAEFAECFAEYGVVQAGSAAQALAILQQPNEIGLVFLDVCMAGESGLELLPRLRALSPRRRIVIFTAYSSTAVAVAALRGQADDYLEKPVDPETTRRLIEQHLQFVPAAAGMPFPTAAARLERVRAFVRDNIHQRVLLADAARLLCITPKHLSRLFCRQHGQGFAAFKVAVRIDRAKELLATTGRTVSQIADDVGYDNHASLTRQFKRATGLTPDGFRRQSGSA